MRKVYHCAGCGVQLPNPVYVRLQLTRCGLVNVRAERNRHKAVALGHLCKGCLAARVRAILGPDVDLGGLAGLLSP